MGDKLPRGSLAAATQAMIRSASDFGHDGLVAGDAEAFARAALEAVLPLIERDAARKMARHVLALDSLDRLKTRNKPPWTDMQTSLRKLARGEELASEDEVRRQLEEMAR